MGETQQALPALMVRGRAAAGRTGLHATMILADSRFCSPHARQGMAFLKLAPHSCPLFLWLPAKPSHSGPQSGQQLPFLLWLFAPRARQATHVRKDP